jgi:Ca2+-binding RTX toxin-like protein
MSHALFHALLRSVRRRHKSKPLPAPGANGLVPALTPLYARVVSAVGNGDDILIGGDGTDILNATPGNDTVIP